MAENKFRIWHHAGLTSCLSVRLHEICRYRHENRFMPEDIDFHDLFLQYRDYEGEDVNEKLMAPYHPDNELPVVKFRHTWQFKWYNKIEFEKVAALAQAVCAPSHSVLNKAAGFITRAEGRTAILYRGNDKETEIRNTPYEAMVAMANETGNTKFIVQTDEEEFFNYFADKFPDSIAFDEIPRIKKNGESFVLPEKGKRVEFAVNFLAAIVALSKCKAVCTVTGNVAMWLVLYRGHTNGVWQYHGRKRKYKNLQKN